MDTVVKQQDEQVKDKSEHGRDHDHGHKHHHKHEHCHDRRREDHESRHIRELEKTIREVADALAHLGRGEPLHELLHIIHRPGWTTEAELAFVNAILRSIALQVRSLECLEIDLVEAACKVRGQLEFTCKHREESDHR